MTREELEADYQRVKKQSQQDYKDLFGSEAPSLRRDASNIIKNELSETVRISKKEYDQLIKDARLLAFLEATGVENWSGWDFAVKEMEKGA